MRHSMLKAILFADAVQYSQHMAVDEPSTVESIQRCFDVFRTLAPQYRGEVLKTMGDGALADFESAVEALRFGLEVQSRFREMDAALAPDRRIDFRIGIDLGEVQFRDGELFGHIVNVAARLQSLAEPGSICISQAVFDQVHRQVAATYRSLGPQALKNIPRPVLAYQVQAGEENAQVRDDRLFRRLTISVLDQFSVRSSLGEELTPGSLKARALLGYLVLSHRSGEMRERLAGLLWSDRNRMAARHALAAVLKQIGEAFRRAGSDALTSGSDKVSVAPAGLDVDLLSISEALAQGSVSNALLEGRVSPDGILAGLDHVDDVFASWLRVARHRWRERLVEQLERCIERFGGDVVSMKHAATALLAIDPSHERAACVLMRAYASEGQGAAALRVYRALADVLSSEFGIGPSPEAEEIVAAIRSGRSGAGAIAAPSVIAKGQAGRLPVIEVRPFVAPDAMIASAHLLSGFRADIIGCLTKFREWVIIEDQDNALAEPGNATIDYMLDARSPVGEGVVVVTLIEVKSNHVLWSERFPLALEDWIQTSAGIARRIAATLDIYLSAERVSGSHGRRDLSLSAYDAWLRGENLLLRWAPEAEAEAEVLFREVIQTMPQFAPAYSSLASIFNVRHLIVPGFRRDPQLAAEALRLAQTAVQLDPLETRAHLTLAWSCIMAGRFEQAAIHYDLAFELNPNNPRTLLSCAHGLAFLGDSDKAASLERLALELSPVVASYQWGYIAGIHFIAEDYAGSVSAAERGAGSLLDLHAWRAAALAHLGRPREAGEASAEFLASVRRQWGDAAPDDPGIVSWVLHGLPFKDEKCRQRFVHGLRIAGLNTE
nr:BTAD domain-containing putative transcriptional regulator [Mycoplana sp. BE70]